MLWYFLYPVRGTTKPPTLSDSHPIRRAFYRHGILTANYWLLVMLAAVAVGVALSYPTVFLSENPTAGFTSIPHHVWTAAKPVGNDESVHADVEMRQVWVHGSYMQALEKDVLKSALVIQQTLVGGERPAALFPGLNEKLESSELSWGYHSPLMYWNSSLKAIEQDDDVVQTINDQARSSSSLNVALRPASVLAGKQFHQRKLIAADALVLTLMNKVEDGVGTQWQDKMHYLEGRACENCTLYPPHGEISRSHVYEFSFTPLSVRENVALAFAYGCMALYVIISLRRLKAFHSRFGLVVTAITQITISIMASFTICGMLKINLATIPSNAYPFIVLVIGLENMFRIINAIVAYPPTMATDQRIANALGDIGPLSVATAIQNIIILWLLAIIVSPGVKAFCVFASIATLFDSFFLLTFFIAVLNVDIRRLELQDSLARSNQTRHKRRPSPSQRTWFDALMHGRVPFSTRMAGSAVTTTFILSLNYHFFEQKEATMNLRHLLGLAVGRGTPDLDDFESVSPPPINATLSPDEWIRMQDFDTAREVMRLVKPGAHDFVIRIFSPLVVVLSGADRTGVPTGVNVLTSALRSFALHHFYPFAVVVVFVVAFVAVLMNFLLWNESSDVSDAGADENLGVQHVALPHSLDIVKMVGSRKGHFVTIGLDRTVGIAMWDRSQGAYLIDGVPRDLTSRLAWPIRNMAIDGTADHIAFHCADDEVFIYKRRSRTFMEAHLHYPDDHPPVLFAFESLHTPDGIQEHLVILTSGGRIATLCLVDATFKRMDLSATPLLGASLIKLDNGVRQLFTVSETAAICSYHFISNSWEQSVSSEISQEPIQDAVDIAPLSDHISDLLVISTNSKVLFVDSKTLNVVASLDSGLDFGQVSVLLGRTTECKTCGYMALFDFALCSEPDRRNELNMLTKGSVMREDGLHAICLGGMQPDCHTLNKAVESKNSLCSSGTSQALSSHAILGLRKRPAQDEKSNGHPQLRQRRQARPQMQNEHSPEEWEAYSFSLSGGLKSVDIATNGGGQDGEGSLYVTQPGPIVRLGAQSVAVAFGNAVKVIKASTRNGTGFRRESVSGLERHGSTMSRKRNGGGRKVQ